MTWTYHPELLATPVPRYTSYPTAAEFHDGVGVSDVETALESVPEGTEISLYLHIPYCREICWYCGCNTGAANKVQRLAAYLDSVEVEVDLVAERLGGRGRVGRIAFGGGSPNAIAPADFLRLMRRVRERFEAEDAVVSVELDPRTLTPDWLAAMAEAGVERASMGVQTLEPAVQTAIGRVQPEAAIRAAVSGLRAAGVASINFDLMYGLPGQSEAELRRTLEATLDMAPERIALFGYAHVPHLIPRQRRIDATALPDAEERFNQAELGFRMLTEVGYEPIGFDHFAVPNDALAVASREGLLRRNFQGFTDDPAEIVVGLGASAISRFPRMFVQSEKNAGRYRMLLSAGRLPGERGVRRSGEDRARGQIIEALLCRGEAEAGAFATDEVRDRIGDFETTGLVGWDGASLRIEESGRPYARCIASLFDAYRTPSGRRFSSAI